MLEIKNIVTEMKNAFDGLISNQYTTEDMISELESISKMVLGQLDIHMKKKSRLRSHILQKY